MNGDLTPVRAGFIPLIDAAALIVAADRGFAAEEGLRLELVREVSWANVRDRLMLGQFDAAHILAPLAIAAALGSDYTKVEMAAPLALGLNGNAVVVSTGLYRAISDAAPGDLNDPAETGLALSRVIAARRKQGAEPLVFGMVFPFSSHNYQLRYWMAAAGIDPDRDVQLVVLPPPYVADALAKGQLNGFCVGAPWASVAVAQGVGHILHFGVDLIARCPEKVLATRSNWAAANAPTLQRLVRACARAAAWCAAQENRTELAQILSAPERLGIEPQTIRQILDGRLMIAPNGETRADARFFVLDGWAALRPDPRHALWLYAQMVRWRQIEHSPAAVMGAAGVYRPDLFDAALTTRNDASAADGIGAFAGPLFTAGDVAGYLAAVARSA
ncbi:CmpA/NrtA family ABC transporter substrate-binding protein [Dongia deserti]|uniref:CmpA/NrtA family ABC transporter substrate-binding protein n=1 Tax=Dongia deserti TaxID=2268030 RepID=UPI000E65BCA2|nr:CmpA/NrtA family ABC transporter substrate-binding protein [Dongia deserti]